MPRRRSRCAARAATRPAPCRCRSPRRAPLVAVGAELKSTFCVVRGGEAFLSPHLGDLDTEPAYRAFRADLDLYLDMLDVEPARHRARPPSRATSRRSGRTSRSAELVDVQHHHAHAAACLAEHGDTGAGARASSSTARATATTARSGAASCCAATSPRFERVAHLEPVPLPGGEAAIREPWRIAAAYLEGRAGPCPFERWPLVREA